MAMPNRNLSAVDTRRTDVLIKDENFSGSWIRSVKFPNGVSFRNEDLADVSAFTDLDLNSWFWSKELIEAARAEGINRLRTMSVVAAAQHTIERL